MNDQGKNLIIGLFAIAACTLLIWSLLFLNPTVGDGEQVLRVRFSSIEGINEGTRVTFAGKPVGRVIAINQIYEARDQPTDRLGRTYFYEVIMAIDSSVHVYDTDEVVLHTTGLFGEKSIAIIPETPAIGQMPVLITDQVIYGQSADRMEQTFNQVVEMANQMGETFGLISDLIVDTDEDLKRMIRSVADVADEVTITMQSVNSQQLVPSMRCAMDGLCQLMHRVDDQVVAYQKEGFFTDLAATVDHLKGITAGLDQPEKLSSMVSNLNTFAVKAIDLEEKISDTWPCIQLTFANMAIVTRKARTVMDNLEAITDKISSGEGTLGKLIEQNDLYLRISSVMNKAETLMNDINGYGLLFHLNKTWQRQRSRRTARVYALNTARGFQRYVDQELDQINTALSRLSLLIQRADEHGMACQLIDNREFAREFLDLLERVKSLEDHLQLYNQEILNTRNR